MSTDITSIYANHSSNCSHSSSFYSADAEQQQQTQMKSRRNSSKLSAAELRKINKPIVEKKRRERINGSLDELKSLLILFGSIASGESLAASTSQQVESQTKLEKADILELTVKRLKQLEENRLNGWSDTNQYVSGYNACFSDASEIIQSTTSNADALSREVFLEQLQARQKQTILQKSTIPNTTSLTTRPKTEVQNKHLGLQYTRLDDPKNDQENLSAFTSLKQRNRHSSLFAREVDAIPTRIPFSEKSTANLDKQQQHSYPRHFADISNTVAFASHPIAALTPPRSEPSKVNVPNKSQKTISKNIWRPF